MGSLVNLFWFLCKKVGPNCVAKLDYKGLKFEVIESNKNIAKKKVKFGFLLGAFL